VTLDTCLSIVVHVSVDLSEITLRMAGAVGAAGLTLAARMPGLLAAVDQHAAEVRDALAVSGRAESRQDARRGPAPSALLGYARGFVEAAVGRGWSPRPGGAADWESLRLAAICQLMTQAAR
jgi:hypothetical protein